MGKTSNSPGTIDEALEMFWLDRFNKAHHVPDYAGFSDWVAEKMEAARSEVPLPLHAHTQPPLVQLTWGLLKAAEAAGIKITRDGATPANEHIGSPEPGQSKLKALNRAKLLLSFFKHLTPRAREMYVVMVRRVDLDPLAGSSLSQSEHRAAFFQAIASGDQHLAFKMVGRLREEAHDLGEVAFLEATASFHANRFDEAIHHARYVSRDAIDWPRAFMLILESHAYRGDLSAMSSEIAAAADFKFPPHFIQYLCEVAIENSAEPESAFEESQALIERVSSQIGEGCGAYVMWNRHSCQLAVRLVEHLQGAASVPSVGQADEDDPSVPEDYPLRVRQIAFALAVDADLLSAILGSSLDESYREVVKRLINHTTAVPDDYLIALTAQWRIGDHGVFLDNIVANLELLAAHDVPARAQLLGWAYQEAQMLKRNRDANLVRQRLLIIPDMAGKVAQAEADANTSGREQRLSRMGRLALRSAYWDLERAERDDRLWRDAGMLSLGFFRILELEFNERLILPLMRTVEFGSLEEEFNSLEARESGGATKKAVEFWKRLLPSLRRAATEQKGLELGALELLLKKLAEVSGVDAPLKALLYTGLVANLSPEGANALKSGQLADVISESPRERFRNPPAHARYVSLSTAKDCMKYVEQALDHLARWTEGIARDDATLH